MAKLLKKTKGAVPSINEASDNLTPDIEQLPVEPTPALIPAPVKVAAVKETKASEELVPLNFKVPASFKKEYKQLALDNNLSLVDVLKISFSTYKKITK